MTTASVGYGGATSTAAITAGTPTIFDNSDNVVSVANSDVATVAAVFTGDEDSSHLRQKLSACEIAH